MNSALFTGLLGVALGMRHALEPDHLAAVSTLATEHQDARAGLWVGALWGIGHSATLLVVGGSLALFEQQMPPRLTDLFEVVVALVIVSLGVRAIARAWKEGQKGLEAPHEHGGVHHMHAAPQEHVHVWNWTLSTRPLFIGAMHGLAGSGALTALVLAEQPDGWARLTYIGLFGGGSLVGMAVLTGLAGVPLMKLARLPRVAAAMLAVVGVISTGIGAWWGLESGTRLLGG